MNIAGRDCVEIIFKERGWGLRREWVKINFIKKAFKSKWKKLVFFVTIWATKR